MPVSCRVKKSFFFHARMHLDDGFTRASQFHRRRAFSIELYSNTFTQRIFRKVSPSLCSYCRIGKILNILLSGEKTVSNGFSRNQNGEVCVNAIRTASKQYTSGNSFYSNICVSIRMVSICFWNINTSPVDCCVYCLRLVLCIIKTCWANSVRMNVRSWALCALVGRCNTTILIFERILIGFRIIKSSTHIHTPAHRQHT